MRKRLYMTAAALSFALSIVAPAPAADEPKGDLARLQGSWKGKVGPGKDIPVTVTIKGNAVELVIPRPDGDEARVKGEIKLDEKASPKTLDWVNFVAPNGDDLPANLGLYKFEGETWVVCSGGPGKERPSKFEAGEGGPPNLTTWTRVDAKDAPAEKKPPEGDLARFQGAWTAKAEGVEFSINLEIKGNAVTARWTRGDGTDVDIKGSMRVNEKAAPKTIDFFDFKDGTGENLKDNLGIYEFSGETIKVCTGGPGNERPTELKAGEGGPPILLVFSRKKD